MEREREGGEREKERKRGEGVNRAKEEIFLVLNKALRGAASASSPLQASPHNLCSLSQLAVRSSQHSSGVFFSFLKETEKQLALEKKKNPRQNKTKQKTTKSVLGSH